MNYHLFSAFLLTTFILVIVPGPIVTLVITTGATRRHPCGLDDGTRLHARQRGADYLHCSRRELDSADFGGSF
jgi:hypothetical protein